MYMAPERISGLARVDFRSDIYALGAVGYFLLTGSHPFPGGELTDLLYQVVHTDPQPLNALTGKTVPEALSRLINSCMAKDPEQRPKSMGAFLDQLK